MRGGQPVSPSPVQGVWDPEWGEHPQAGWAPVPATMRVKSKPFFTDLRCTWLGSVAKPTYSLSSCRGQRGHGTRTPPAHLLPWKALPFLLPAKRFSGLAFQGMRPCLPEAFVFTR